MLELQQYADAIAAQIARNDAAIAKLKPEKANMKAETAKLDAGMAKEKAAIKKMVADQTLQSRVSYYRKENKRNATRMLM